MSLSYPILGSAGLRTGTFLVRDHAHDFHLHHRFLPYLAVDWICWKCRDRNLQKSKLNLLMTACRLTACLLGQYDSGGIAGLLKQLYFWCGEQSLACELQALWTDKAVGQAWTSVVLYTIPVRCPIDGYPVDRSHWFWIGSPYGTIPSIGSKTSMYLVHTLISTGCVTQQCVISFV